MTNTSKSGETQRMLSVESIHEKNLQKHAKKKE